MAGVAFKVLFVCLLVGLCWTHPSLLTNEVEASEEHDSLWNKLLSILPVKKTLKTVQSDPQLGSSRWLSCTACKIGAKSLQWYIHMGASKASVANIATYFCKHFGVSTDRACQGISREFQDEVMYVFTQVSLNPTQICGSIVDEDCGGGSDVTKMWNVSFPDVPKPPVEPIKPPSPSSPTLRVLHLSDIHLDLDYCEGCMASCHEPLCCHQSSSMGQPVKEAFKAGTWGDYRKCDTPVKTLENALRQISKTQNISYIIWTGDDTPHNIWNQTKANQITTLTTVGTLIKKYFPNVPAFPALGNHEGIPVNSFPLFDGNSTAPMSWLYEALTSSWTRWLPQEASTTITKGGFYSVPVFPGFRIISLNMNFCNNLNWWLLLNSTDPMGELQWLINELQNAENNNEKVHILGHIPPGSSDCLKAWSYNYYKIVNRYESRIRSQFFGHTHVDEFEVFYDLSQSPRRPISTAYVGPSMTTYVNLNPSYRVYTIDGNYSDSSWVVLDYETYYFNLSEANSYGKPKWRMQYRAKDAYEMDSLLPADWNDLISRLAKDDKLFQSYYRHYQHASDAYQPCDLSCKKSLLCRMQTARALDQTLCQIQ